jgi:predicted nucleotidyltransferase
MSTISAEEVDARLDDLPLSMPALDLLVLFGSTVKGRRRAESGLDIAVRFDGPATSTRCISRWHSASASIGSI